MVKQAVSQLTVDYPLLLEDLRSRIRAAQVRAVLAVNRELILLYWEIGQRILESQRREGWGAKVVERLAADLRLSFPEIASFSPRNLLFMRAFAEEFSDLQIVKQLVSQIPWGHIVRVMQKLKVPAEREFYIHQAIAHGWSRSVLVHQIESGLYGRQGQALNNFDRVLPSAQSDLARQALKDPYIFDFLSLGDEARERDLERGLIQQVRRFLLELGAGFALVGTQYSLEVDGQEFFLDLLFYHLRLRCYVVVELKVAEFQPEHAGKMSFYLTAVDNLLRHPDDQPTIGLILCKTKSRLVAEYTLQGQQKPIGVASYLMMPAHLRGTLPSPQELEAGLVDGDAVN
jgi:predicted nuclease of restriction endonuclease-like (RecB) superfamily